MIIAGTGFWVALANRKDAFHRPCVDFLNRCRERLITTWPVVTETCHLLVSRSGIDAELSFVQSAQRGGFEIYQLTVGHLSRVEKLIEKYRSLPMELADASLVVLAEELGSGRIVSTDRRDFNAYRWKNRHPFTNLLEH